MDTIGESEEQSERSKSPNPSSHAVRSAGEADEKSPGSSHRRVSPDPSIFSESKEERIRARRVRIRRRIEEEERRANKGEGDTGTERDLSPKQERVSVKQVVKSKQELDRMIRESDQLLRDVIIAGDAREMNRRRGEDDNLKTRTEKLEAESNTGKERFDEIAKRWESSLVKNLPQELHDLLEQQRSDYEEMTNEKNRLIKEFESELKVKDDQYVRDLRQQAEDVDLLLERMENQARTVAQAYNKELREIENAFTRERGHLVEEHGSDHSRETEDRGKLEVQYMEDYQRLVGESDTQLEELLRNGAEDYRATKIQLEKDIQFLQIQLEQMKATFRLNVEKLDYNFQVVKKRDEENKKTENQQKRKISRLQDQYNNQRSRRKTQEEKFSVELKALGEEYQKAANQLRDLQLKLSHFQETDEKKFNDVWAMSEEEVRGLVKDVLKTDEIIHSQQLGVDWTSPAIPESSYRKYVPEQTVSATHIVQEVFSSSGSSQASLLSDQGKKRGGGLLDNSPLFDGQLGEFPHLYVRQALEMISREADFLVEEKLNSLLAPLDKEEQVLMKLDAIFQALQVESKSDIIQLLQYVILCIEEEYEGEDLESEPPVKFELIQPEMVSQALRSYIEIKKEREAGIPAKVTSRVDKERERREVLSGGYWHQMANILPPMHECLWTGLHEGLMRYNHELEQRENLIDETDSLQLQNDELKMLLQQYLEAQVNRELLQPPMQTISLT